MEVQNQEQIQQVNKEPTNKVAPLLNLLSELCHLYEELYKILQEEKRFLISADITSLTENNKIKESLLYKIRTLDRQREKLALDLASSLGVKAENARLLNLANQIFVKNPQSAEGKELKNYHSKLSRIIMQVTDHNADNAQYAENALKVFDGAISEIKQIVSAKPVYGKKGKMSGATETNSGNFVSKEV